jgi:hypothetical protein
MFTKKGKFVEVFVSIEEAAKRRVSKYADMIYQYQN